MCFMATYIDNKIVYDMNGRNPIQKEFKYENYVDVSNK